MKENTVEIKVELVGYEELLEKLNNIKKLLQEIAGINIQVEEKQIEIMNWFFDYHLRQY